MQVEDRVVLMTKETKSKGYREYVINYSFVTKNNKNYLFIENERHGSEKEEVLWVIDNKIELTERYKDLRDTNNRDSFVHFIKEDEDILKRVKYYMSYSDENTKWSKRNFALVELTDDDLTKYLHHIM